MMPLAHLLSATIVKSVYASWPTPERL